MGRIYLQKVSERDTTNRNIYQMLQSIDQEENGFMNGGYGISWEEYPGYIEKLIAQYEAPELEKGYVPQTIYWLMDDEEVLGYSKMRHYLTDKLRAHGGHIGYGIRKEQRNKGYGKKLLELTLNEIKKRDVNDVLITCDETNRGSRKVIEWNNGILEKIEHEHCYYWIKI